MSSPRTSLVKIEFNGDVRRLNVDFASASPSPYSQLVTGLKVLYQLPADSKFVLKYEDDENELITISSASELLEAHRIALGTSRSLKVYVYLADSDARSFVDNVNDAASSSSADSFVDVVSKVVAPEPVPLQAPPQPEVPPPAPTPEPEKKPAVSIEDAVDSDEDQGDDAPANDDDDDDDRTDDDEQAPASAGPEFPSWSELQPLALDFVANPKIQAHTRAVLPVIIPGLVAGSMTADDAIDRLLVEENVRAHPLTQRLLPLRSLIVEKITCARSWLNWTVTEFGHLAQLLVSGAGNEFVLPLDFILPALPSFAGFGVVVGDELKADCVQQPAVSSAPRGKAVHRNIQCDGCQAFPVVGARYKCTKCPNYDLCETCESANKHPADHVLIKINRPPEEKFDEQGRTIHRGVACDGCGVRPLIGNRFKCSVCPNFDLCEACEKTGTHPATHNLLKMREPVDYHTAEAFASGRRAYHHGHRGHHGHHGGPPSPHGHHGHGHGPYGHHGHHGHGPRAPRTRFCPQAAAAAAAPAASRCPFLASQSVAGNPTPSHSPVAVIPEAEERKEAPVTPVEEPKVVVPEVLPIPIVSEHVAPAVEVAVSAPLPLFEPEPFIAPVVPSAPKPEELAMPVYEFGVPLPADFRYVHQLRQLKKMGFDDVARNITTLGFARGNVETTIDMLLAN